MFSNYCQPPSRSFVAREQPPQPPPPIASDAYQPAMLFRDPMQPYPGAIPGSDFYIDPSTAGFNARLMPNHADYFAYQRQPPFFALQQRPSNNQSIKCEWINEDGKMCGLYFIKEQITNHLANAHLGICDSALHMCRWNNCPRADKPFKAKYKLVNHVRVHTGERPFACDRCHKLFARSENMKIHMRTHTGDKPFSCTHKDCDRKFANSSDRKKHLHVHTSTKPFVCKYAGCNKTYTHPSSLRKHLKIHEKNCESSPELDESSDSGHASAGTPSDEFVKQENEIPSSFSYPSPPVMNVYAPPPHFATQPIFHPEMYRFG